jgi:SSS family solute:Na+ symporter
MMRTPLGVLLLSTLLTALPAANGGKERFRFHPEPSPPTTAAPLIVATHGPEVLAIDSVGGQVWRLAAGANDWTRLETPFTPPPGAVAAAVPDGVVLLASGVAYHLAVAGGVVVPGELPPPPAGLAPLAVTSLGRTLYATDGVGLWALDRRAGTWREEPPPPVAISAAPVLVASQDSLFLFGAGGAASYRPRDGWRVLDAPPWWPEAPAATAFGHAHLFVFGPRADGSSGILAHHTYTGTWLALDDTPPQPWSAPRAVTRGERILVMDTPGAVSLTFVPVPTGYSWLDHTAVLLYLGGMVWMGFYFAKREKSTRDFFRAGQRIPWWAAGMSLFATGASAISLMAMPGKAFSSDLTYLGISFYAVIALPIAVFVLAPLVRRLAITTPGQYLERRFGLGARMLAASIYVFTQVGARMGSVMLLPSIAMSAITGVPIVTCILVMGAVTTIYTFLGGLEAVIWTDTVQGFVMIASVVGCLALALWRLEAPPAESWAALQHFDKLVVFDLRWDLTYPTAYLLFVTTVLGTLGGIGDQNFVQRVQCTPDLRQTKLAVATQLAVAVPINLLLFTLGLVLFLFYRQHPEALSATMKTDSVFPFFVAQQLPLGVSGLVVGALLAATMSTISSSICSVANIGVEDFARRFRPSLTDHGALMLGRVLTAAVGIAGTGTAVYLSQSTMPSIWDLAQMVTNLISNGIVGLFALGLLTRRAHQLGAILGVACGMGAVLYLQHHTEVSFWAFTFVGSVVTFVTGYVLSLVLPGRPRATEGLTLHSLGAAAPTRSA